MCFSAGASFGAGIVLSAIGVASIKKAQSSSEIVFASIPLIFSIQQISEGFLWLALTNPLYEPFQQVSTYTFLFFAQFVWPLWIPLSIFLLEKNQERKNILKLFIGTGITISLTLLYCLLMFSVDAKIVEYHITYEQNFPTITHNIYGQFFYIITIVAPPFVSTIKRMNILGAGILISCIITAIFYEDYYISVWCFFASVISVIIFAITSELKKSNIEISVVTNVDSQSSPHNKKI